MAGVNRLPVGRAPALEQRRQLTAIPLKLSEERVPPARLGVVPPPQLARASVVDEQHPARGQERAGGRPSVQLRKRRGGMWDAPTVASLGALSGQFLTPPTWMLPRRSQESDTSPRGRTGDPARPGIQSADQRHPLGSLRPRGCTRGQGTR